MKNGKVRAGQAFIRPAGDAPALQFVRAYSCLFVVKSAPWRLSRNAF
jgi:hypothetical protein